jgi:hypothetical protein
MKTNFNFDAAGAFGILFGLVGLGFAAWQAKKQDDLAKKLDLSIEELAKKTPVEISDNMVEKAVQTATDREVKAAVHEASKNVKAAANETLTAEIKKEVGAYKDTIKSQVTEELTRQVSLIDEGTARAEVVKRAEEKVLQKFDGSLDGVLNEARDECRRRLNSVTKSWESIADWAETLLPRRNSSSSGSGMTFRVE